MNNKENFVSIFARNIDVRVRIGLLDSEKRAPQRLIVSAELYADPEKYFKNIDPEHIIDYARMVEFAKSWEERPHVCLIETYAKELMDFCLKFPAVVAAKISITKPDIFEGSTNVGVEVFKNK